MDDPCPCGLPATYADCCGRFHAGAEPDTPERCMRARYSAHVKGDTAFLLRSSHPLRRAKTDMRQLRAACQLRWLGLEIVATTPDTVHFRARYAQNT